MNTTPQNVPQLHVTYYSNKTVYSHMYTIMLLCKHAFGLCGFASFGSFCQATSRIEEVGRLRATCRCFAQPMIWPGFRLLGFVKAAAEIARQSAFEQRSFLMNLRLTKPRGSRGYCSVTDRPVLRRVLRSPPLGVLF